MLRFFATAPKGLEDLLAEELRELGAADVEVVRAGVGFAGALEVGYRACLWSRLASRVLLPIAEVPASSPEALYEAARGLDWGAHLGASGTLAVDFSATRSSITHTQYGALKVKDAIVDVLRERHGERPSVDTQRPDVRVNVHAAGEVAIVSIDLSGESLHRRGYREQGVAAPLKENLAAGVLLRARWPGFAAQGAPLVDPMCGSGTLPLEAALMAGDVAPGLLRDYFGLVGWRGHDAALWRRLREEAEERRRAGASRIGIIVGADADPRAIAVAYANAARAGLVGAVHFERVALEQLEPQRFCGEAKGLMVVNPPYGVRLGSEGGAADERAVAPLYEALGATLKERFAGWTACVLTTQGELASHLRLRATRRHTLYNGALACWLLTYELHAVPEGARAPRPQVPGVEDLVNRLRKNQRTLGAWAAREGISCYRVYDADLPEFAMAIDVYERWLHVQEYAPPRSVDVRLARRRREAVIEALPEVMGVPREDVFVKVRERQKGKRQYERREGRRRFFEVHEGGHAFAVNFETYLDTGLFLDHRLTRRMLGELAAGRRFLNLFCYTATATVYAARGGATASTSVDLSNTYLDWAAHNFELNGVSLRQHELVQGDCMEWLRRARGKYGLVFVDPPTFSTSKRMEGVFDVQRDHVELLERCAALLEPGGVIVFSNNFRRFKLDEAALAPLHVEDVTRATIPKDFARNPRIHRCWKITA